MPDILETPVDVFDLGKKFRGDIFFRIVLQIL